MTMPRNYEKEMAEMLVEFRAAQTVLNQTNAEAEAKENEREVLYAEVSEARNRYDKVTNAYNEWCMSELGDAQKRVIEARSEVMAIQAKLLDIQVEFMLRGGE